MAVHFYAKKTHVHIVSQSPPKYYHIEWSYKGIVLLFGGGGGTGKGGTQHIFGWGGDPVTQILTLFKNKLNNFRMPIFDTQLETFNLKKDPVSDKKIIVLAWGSAVSD